MPDGFASFYPLKVDRMHEVCGRSGFFFAFALAAHIGGPVLWIRENWRSDRINPPGFAAFLDPGNLLVASAENQLNVLAVAEESLRSGAVSLVIMELSKALDLTAGRRLQLAARDGKAIALAIIPDGMGSNAAETRWRSTSVFDRSDSTLHRWDLIKNKSGTLGAWNVRWDQKTRRISVVSPVGERPGSAGARD